MFGRKVNDKDGLTPLHHLIRTVKEEDGHMAQFLIMEAFDDRYGIQDIPYDENDNPLAVVSYTKSEDLGRDMFDIRMDQYTNYRVYDIMHIGFLDLIQLPSYKVEKILEKCKRESIKQAKDADALRESLKEPVYKRKFKRK